MQIYGTQERQWIYDGQLRPVAEMDGTGALVSQFVYATHINVPDYIIKGGVTYRIITDHLGSLRFVIDASTGTIAQRMDYDDWGNVLVNTAPDFTPFGFAGGMYDSQTKLTRFGARDYDAETGRWTAKDPIGFGSGSGNLYAYIDNDPLTQIDVTGLGSVGGFLRQFNRLCAGMLGRYLDYNLSALSKDTYNPIRGKGPCGTTLLRVPKMLNNFGRQGVTLGDYIFLDADAPDSVTQHELGHVAQFDEYGPNLYGLYAGSYVFTYIQQQIFGMKVDPAVNSYFERTADNMKPKDCECGK